jgi:hypothetical protein
MEHEGMAFPGKYSSQPLRFYDGQPVTLTPKHQPGGIGVTFFADTDPDGMPLDRQSDHSQDLHEELV